MFLSVYENKVEKRIDRVIERVKLGHKNNKRRRELIDLFLEYPIETTVWLEYKYKGYKFLKKSRRRNLYEVMDEIEADFLEWMEGRKFDDLEVELVVPERLTRLEEKEDVWRLMMIGEFMKSRFKYRESSAFWKLFPNNYGEEGVRIIGDCNQVVTFYIWLYGVIADNDILDIRVLPNHVCLHLHGLDFEATNGGFKDYGKKGYVVGCENIVAVNLLDIHDPIEKRWDVSEVNVAKMQAVADLFEVEEDLVELNLKITYTNMGVFYMNSKRWNKARKFFEMAGDEKRLEMTYVNEAVDLTEQKKYKKAMRVARKGGLEDMESKIRKNYCIKLAGAKNWKKAMVEARKLGDKEMIQYVYGKEFEHLYGKVGGVETVKGARKNKTTYKRLLFLAKKLRDKKAEESVRSIIRKI
jgi:hypothetical protein